MMFLALIALVFINVPIAVALGIVALVAMVATSGPAVMPNLALVLFDGATKFSLIAIPLFILAGAIMNSSGISRRLIAFASALFGFIRGGLAMVSIGTSLFFAEISGSAVADVAALGSVLIPAMERKGYSKEFAAAVTSSSATLAVIIPPSIPMILYAVMSGSSVVEVFVAGIIPGVVGGVLMMAVAYRFAVRHNYPVEQTFQLSRLWQTFKDASWSLLLPVIILGGIFTGWGTATEGAGRRRDPDRGAYLSGARPETLTFVHARRRRANRSRHAASSHVGIACDLFDRNPGATKVGSKHDRANHESVPDPGHAELFFPGDWSFSSLGSRHYLSCPDRNAIGLCGRYRPGSLRSSGNFEPGNRTADAPSCQCSRNSLFSRQS